jgi:hypothetical protein
VGPTGVEVSWGVATLLVPEALRGIGGLREADPTFFGTGFVYFLVRNGVVVYVGQTRHLLTRIGRHKGWGAKKFDRVLYIETDISSLDHVERSFIEQLDPIYNRTYSPSRPRPLTGSVARRVAMRGFSTADPPGI